MKFLPHLTIVCLLSISSATSPDLKSQTRADKKITPATITGKVTIKGNGVSGIVVVLNADNQGLREASSYRATTDQDGNYRISNVPPGSYQVFPDAPSFVLSSERRLMLVVAEGESVKDVNFVLTKGGVITGRITNSEGQPMIEQEITLTSESRDQNGGNSYMEIGQAGQTDDRGVYRIFGLSPGKYKIAVGQDDVRLGGRSQARFRQTFYPDVTDISRAATVEVSEGGEVANIDIKVESAESDGKYAVSGRIVDGVTGQPVSNLMIGLQRVSDNRTESVSGPDFVSDNQGKFKIENLAPGNYSVYVASTPNNELTAEPVPFEIIDADVNGLVLKTNHGASVSGVIIFEGSNQVDRTKVSQLVLQVYVSNQTPMQHHDQSTPIGQDGTFHVGGLQAGIVSFSIGSTRGGAVKSVSRVERNGIAVPHHFEIRPGEQVAGLKLVVNLSNGTVRGIVKLENAELPPGANISVWFTNTGDNPYIPQPEVDSRGHFVAEGLAAGTYEINAAVYVQGARKRAPSTKQQVTVTDGGITEVTLTLDLTP